jgi:MFS transporter, DHA1 family, solute carrier family 18 (vesicular amine transporter), member 1/2
MSPRPAAVVLVTLATFVDLLTYSVAVPVLPDLATRLGASPTTIGFLFASFGVTLFGVSIPMGGLSDRIGRRAPMVGALVALAASTLLFAFATSLPWLFAARLVQGAADAMTWVVGLALIADLYSPQERGRIVGIMMSGTSFGLMVGPSVGGWLYEFGGIRTPFVVVAVFAAAIAAGFAVIEMPAPSHARSVPIGRVLAVPAVRACVAAAIAGSATIAMLEPVLSLFFAAEIQMSPSRVGSVFGVAALASTLAHPVWGALSDRFGAQRLMTIGLVASGCFMPLMTLTSGAWSAAILLAIFWPLLGMIVTPSLALIGDAASAAGIESFGVAYGLYNVAWAIGLMSGPAIGGYVYDRTGFQPLVFLWAPALIAFTLALHRFAGRRRAPLPA